MFVFSWSNWQPIISLVQNLVSSFSADSRFDGTDVFLCWCSIQNFELRFISFETMIIIDFRWVWALPFTDYDNFCQCLFIQSSSSVGPGLHPSEKKFLLPFEGQAKNKCQPPDGLVLNQWGMEVGVGPWQFMHWFLAFCDLIFANQYCGGILLYYLTLWFDSTCTCDLIIVLVMEAVALHSNFLWGEGAHFWCPDINFTDA